MGGSPRTRVCTHTHPPGALRAPPCLHAGSCTRALARWLLHAHSWTLVHACACFACPPHASCLPWGTLGDLWGPPRAPQGPQRTWPRALPARSSSFPSPKMAWLGGGGGGRAGAQPGPWVPARAPGSPWRPQGVPSPHPPPPKPGFLGINLTTLSGEECSGGGHRHIWGPPLPPPGVTLTLQLFSPPNLRGRAAGGGVRQLLVPLPGPASRQLHRQCPPNRGCLPPKSAQHCSGVPSVPSEPRGGGRF